MLRPAAAGSLAAYAAVARVAFKRGAAFRAGTLAGIFTNTVFGVVLASVMLAVYRERSDVRGLGVDEAITLTFVGQGLLLVVFVFGWRDVAVRVRTGEISADLHRPVDASWYWMCVFLGTSAFSALARGVPPFVAGALIYDLALPEATVTWLAFGAVVAGAAVVASRWWFLVNLASFWVIGDIRGVIQLASAVQVFCSGSLIPLQFLPEPMAVVVRRSPFASMVQLPGEVLLERQGAAGVLAAQLVWALVLELAGRLVWRRAVRRLVIDGG